MVLKPNSLAQSRQNDPWAEHVATRVIRFVNTLSSLSHLLNPCIPEGMLGRSLASPLLAFDCGTQFRFSTLSIAPHSVSLNVISSNDVPPNVIGGTWTCTFSTRNWELYSSAQTDHISSLSIEDQETWEACRHALSPLKFSIEEENKMLGKAFGQVHSPYWGEERKKVIPKLEVVREILDYLRSLSLSDEDLSKLLKKFPEVLGCDLENELRTNVNILERDWGINGKSLRNLLLRNPKVLGYYVDCKGDCEAKCTRCWVRF